MHVRVEIPSKLSNDERKIVEELKDTDSKKPAKKKGFSLFQLTVCNQCPSFIATLQAFPSWAEHVRHYWLQIHTIAREVCAAK